MLVLLFKLLIYIYISFWSFKESQSWQCCHMASLDVFIGLVSIGHTRMLMPKTSKKNLIKSQFMVSAYNNCALYYYIKTPIDFWCVSRD